MRNFSLRLAVAFVCMVSCFTGRIYAQESTIVYQSRLGFLSELKVQIKKKDQYLSLIGEAERSFLFFDIYDIAYYQSAVGHSVDERIEALYLLYERDLSKEKIHEVLLEGIKENLDEADFDSLSGDIDSLLSSIGADVSEGDRLSLVRVSTDELAFYFNEVFILSLTNRLLVQALWDIWMGDRSVVDLGSLTRALP